MTENKEESLIDPDLAGNLNRHCRRAALALMLAAEGLNDYSVESALDMEESIRDAYKGIRERQFFTAVQLMHLVGTRLADVDEELQRVSPRWRVERMAPVDRNLLRLGIFELLNLEPPSVRTLISDYVSLGREFGEQNTHAFVNGLLDQVCRDNGIEFNT